jgi:ATP synthase protein I
MGKLKRRAGRVSSNLQVPAQLKQTVLIPAGITLVVALALSLVGPTEALSSVSGGLIVVLANAFSAWRVFSPAKGESAELALANLYRAEVGKLLMMGALFIAVFAGWEDVNIAAFIAGCAAAAFTAPIATAFCDEGRKTLLSRETGRETDG